MRVLLIEPNPEDALFLRDVLQEIAEGRYWNQWVNLEIIHTTCWTDSCDDPADIVLLASEGIEAFRRMQAAAQDIPMILLLNASEESSGLRYVRHGAQDFLVKKHVDCAPLAHAMQNAIERHRQLTSARAASTHDTLTGLPNRAGFLASAFRDRKLAERLHRRLMVMVAEPRYLDACTDQQKDLLLVEAADHLRSLAGPADLLACIEPTRFGMTVFDTEVEPIEAAWNRIHAALLPHRIQLGAAIFSADHPSTLDTLLDQATADLPPTARAMHNT